MGKLTSLDVLNTVEVAPGRFVVTPHPVTLEGQTNVAADLIPGETLASFLERNIVLGMDAWEVTIGGVVVPFEHWGRVKPKHGQVIELRGAVNKQALMIVAMIALTYFTMGAGAGWIAGTFGVAAGGVAAAMIGAGLFMAGSIVINKVLGPKQPKLSSDDRESVFSLSTARNRPRQNEPLGLLFGSVKIAPDLASLPYTYYQGNDQYLAMVLTPGINVDRVEQIYNGETLLSSFEGVKTWKAGFSGMPDQEIPLFSNADTINGGELASDSTWVERTTSPDTVQAMLNLEYILGGQGTSGKSYFVSETVEVQYRPRGSTQWQPLATRTYRSDKFEVRRDTIPAPVARGQYDLRARILGHGNYSGKNTQKNEFTWSTLTSVQADDTDYAGISRIGVLMKATGQLNGAPDELRMVAHAKPLPIWSGAAWVTATDRASGLSNPGAQMLQYARGYFDENGKLIGGVGLPDEMIDIESLKGFMLHCAANNYTYDYWLTGVRSHEEQLQTMALAGFGQKVEGGGKLLSVAWSADEQPLSGVVNMATIKKGQFQVDYTLANAADGIEYSYFDRTDWQTKTLRVAAPGVMTMLNPAQLQGEGITSEAHAAELARYHLAQHIYQYKDISYSTDLEHLSYKRLSVLALQHDLTQWGYGGRLVAAATSPGGVTLALDEPVPAPASGNAYLGLRVPGETVYRIFTVVPFTGESDTIELAGAWPADAALPGDHLDNPAHDTIWIYDFKQTPGYRVRVVDVQPEAGLTGASVAVVPEGPEFWTYVKTGEYVPAPNSSLLQTRPVASNLKVSESQVVQGDTVFTELAVTFDVSGPVGHTVVQAALVGSDLAEVAQTMTRTARWRIEDAGVYTIVVRPYAPDGTAGVAASIVYTTIGADAPPALFDYFDVQELSGGVRKYSFGFNESDDAPVNLAGAEIRYIAGSVASPSWAAMTPLGEDGFFTSAVEMVIPPAGVWTFACRSRNTAGTLSATAKVLTKTLTANLGEVIGEIGDHQTQTDQEVADALAAALAADEKVAQEIIDRQTADAVLTAEQAVLRAQVGDILEADTWVNDRTYPKGDLVQFGGKLYRAKIAVPVNKPVTNTAYWELLGDYASLGEAVSATAANVVVNTAAITQIDGKQTALSETVTQHAARMPAGTDTLGTKAEITNVATAAASATNAVAQEVSQFKASIGGIVMPVANAGFEGADGWGVLTPDTSFLTYANARTGRRVLEFRPSATTDRNVINSTNVPVTEGKKVSGGFWVRYGGSGAISPTATISVVMRAYDPEGVYLPGSATALASISGSQLTTAYQQLAGVYTTPSGTAFVSLQIRVQSHTSGGSVMIDDAFLEVESYGTSATAQALAATNVTVGQQGETLTTHTGQLSSLSSEVAGKASQSYAEAIDGELQAVGGTVIGHTTAIEGLGITIGQQSASITEVSRVAAAASGVGVVFSPSFEEGPAEQASAQGWGSLPANCYVHVYANARTGTRVLRFDASTTTSRIAFNQARTPVTAGQTVKAGFWLRLGGSGAPNAGATFSVMLRGYDTAGAYVPGSAITIGSIAGSAVTSSYKEVKGTYVVPTGVVSVEVDVRAQNQTSGSVMLDDVYVEPQRSTEADFLASYTLAMNVNGKFSGVKYGNDGTVSNAEFLFDNFDFVTADGAFFIGGGRTINRSNGFMTVTGRPFGVNNEFVEWYGPDIDIDACSRETALSFKTKDGIPYFGGILTKESQSRTGSSEIFGNGTLTCPSHPSNGGRKKINISLSRSNYGHLSGNVTPAGGGIGSAFQATFDLQRKIGAGAWTSIKTHTSNSSVQGTAAYDREFNSTFFSSSGSGGLTFEDTNATVDTVQYRVVYTASGGPPAYSSSAAGTPINRPATQSTKITVIEDAPF